MNKIDPHKLLFEKKLINKQQYDKIELIEGGGLVSLYYELRILLYLGVLLLSTGVGIIVYENIGSIGHIVAIILISILMLYCFYFSFKRQLPYSNLKLKAPNPYFDYILLLGCLLFISVLGYIEFLFGLVSENLSLITLFTSLYFFFIAYRLDHLGILSLAITAFVSFWGVSVSPQQWYGNYDFNPERMYNTGLLLSSFISVGALLLERMDIKRHFSFTYINFTSLIFLCSATVGIFASEYSWLYLIISLLGVAALTYYSIRQRSFLFLLYSYVFGFIAITYLFSLMVPNGGEMLWLYYFVFSGGAFIFFILKYKSLFKRSE